MPPVRHALLLLFGCIVLGVGIGILLVADFGSDGFSTLVNGGAISAGVPFWVSNLVVSGAFVGVGWIRGVRPGIGTIVQMVIVGVTVSLTLDVLSTPAALPGRIGLLVIALPIMAVGIAAYLGANLGAGPMEAASLAFDPPIPFKWAFSALQLITATVGWLLGGTLGFATVVVILALGPMVTLASRLLGLDVHQGEAHHEPVG